LIFPDQPQELRISKPLYMDVTGSK